MITNKLLNHQKSICLTPNGFYCFNSNQTITEPFTELEAVNLIINTHVPLLIPDLPQFPCEMKDYFKLLENEPTFEEYCSENFQGYRILYALTKNDLSKIASFKMQPQFMSLLSFSHKLLAEKFSDEIDYNYFIINILNSEFDLFFYKEGKIVLANRYPFQNQNDILYYLFNLLQQFDVKNENCNLYLLQAEGEQFYFFKNYFKTLSLI